MHFIFIDLILYINQIRFLRMYFLLYFYLINIYILDVSPDSVICILVAYCHTALVEIKLPPNASFEVRI